METKEDLNMKMVRELYKFLDQKNSEGWKEMVTPDLKLFYQSEPKPYTVNEMEPIVEMYYKAFPDYHHEIEDIFGFRDYVVARIRYTATHKNKFMDIEPTGKKIDYRGIFICKITEGRISEIWGVEDELTMMKQLGLELTHGAMA